ncbi:MAG: helix-turn-helix domain-containing protein [Ilumatobacteraceae bacterium]
MGFEPRPRTDMVRAGARLLASSGYEAPALLDVVEAAGVPRGSIYFHFPRQAQPLEALAVPSDRAVA